MTETTSYTIASNGYSQSAVIEQPQTEPQAPPKNVHVLVTADRLDKIPMKFFEGAEGNSLKGTLALASWFFADARGVYYPPAEGLEFLREMPKGQAADVFERILSSMGEASAPKK